jgi:hypothetical protein
MLMVMVMVVNATFSNKRYAIGLFFRRLFSDQSRSALHVDQNRPPLLLISSQRVMKMLS